MDSDYAAINASTIDRWVRDGWTWGRPIDHETFAKARSGDWSVLLTPTKPVPKAWFCDFGGARILGLASGGGQQMPIFSALGAACTVLDYSESQLESERLIAAREGYSIETIRHDMSRGLPFEDERFDLIFHPVSNCYIRHVRPLWKECRRVLKPGGILLSGLDNGINYIVDEDETAIRNALPFDPLADEALFERSIEKDWGIQFSHTAEEQIGGQLEAGFTLTGIYEDVNECGNLARLSIPSYWATRSVRAEIG